MASGVLKDRTAKIIMIVKGQYDFGEGDDNLTMREAIVRYMANECGVAECYYTDSLVNSIIWEAFLDYLDNTDKDIKTILWAIKRGMDTNRDLGGDGDIYRAICGHFMCVNVVKDGEYINGFTEENSDIVTLN